MLNPLQPQALQLLPATMQEHFALLQTSLHQPDLFPRAADFRADVGEELETEDKLSVYIRTLSIIIHSYLHNRTKRRLMLRQQRVQLGVRLFKVLLQLCPLSVAEVRGRGGGQGFDNPH